jgi:hypothetical protein
VIRIDVDERERMALAALAETPEDGRYLLEKGAVLP